MRPIGRAFGFALAAMLVCHSGQAVAGPIVPHSPVNGFQTFQDVATGNIWVKLDTFFNVSYETMKSAVEDGGFTVASKAEVHTLLDSLPLNNGEWPTYASIMGSAPNRGLIWGGYQPSTNPFLVGWAYAFDDYNAWAYVDQTVTPSEIPNEGSRDADFNIFAFIPGQVSAVPEPTTLASAALGLVGVAILRRRRSR